MAARWAQGSWGTHWTGRVPGRRASCRTRCWLGGRSPGPSRQAAGCGVAPAGATPSAGEGCDTVTRPGACGNGSTPRASVGQVKPRRWRRSASHLGTPRLNQSLGPSQSPTSTRSRSRSLWRGGRWVESEGEAAVRDRGGLCWWRQRTWRPWQSPPPRWPGSAPSAPSSGRPAGRRRRCRSAWHPAARCAADAWQGKRHETESVRDTAAAPRQPHGRHMRARRSPLSLPCRAFGGGRALTVPTWQCNRFRVAEARVRPAPSARTRRGTLTHGVRHVRWLLRAPAQAGAATQAAHCWFSRRPQARGSSQVLHRGGSGAGPARAGASLPTAAGRRVWRNGEAGSVRLWTPNTEGSRSVV